MASSTPVADASATTHDPRRKLGVISIALMIIAASAPLTAVGGGFTTSFAVSGNLGVPLSFFILVAVFIIFAFGYAAMSRFIDNAGAFYAYVAQGLNRSLGIGASMVALVAYNLMQIGINAIFGFSVADLFASVFGWETPWWVWSMFGIAIVGLLGVNRIDLSAKVLGIVVALEFLVVLVFDIVAIIAQPEGVSARGLLPADLFGPGVGVAFSFGVAAFMGFESAAIYSREAKDPKRTIGRATMLAIAVGGIFYGLSAWAMTVAVGPSQVVEVAATQGPGLVFGVLAEHAGTIFADIANVMFVTSIFAALLSFHNAVARYFSTLGREGVLPGWLGAQRALHGAPWAGSVTQSVLGIVVLFVFILAESAMTAGWPAEITPLYPVLTMFTWLTSSGAAGLTFLMAIVAVAVIGYFWRNHRGVGVWSRLIAPAIAAVALIVLFVLMLMYFNLLLGQVDENGETFSTWLTWFFPTLLILPLFLGLLWAQRMRLRTPERFAQVGHGSHD
ncbi:APC family permease [Gulosibacter macacae]|uniref:APC family permease n=1 Tax=Gulosibacter macacae TaxID=2488791 RepID=A0A3P3VZQ0_9MICO|nr:APC family permease [Gulosibacter macacae]RRJ88291.1 APC family permease [Gulosibacter macacae]